MITKTPYCKTRYCEKRVLRKLKLIRPRLARLMLLLGLFWAGFGWFSQPANAALLCRSENAQQICILSIERSAKNHWEYRTVVSIDGKKRPLELYNCRDRVRISKDGKRVPFASQGPGPLICRILHR